jgi:hypothetical protein
MQLLVSRRTPLLLALIAALAVPAAAHAAPGSVNLNVQVGHLTGGKAAILSSVPVTGTLSPFVPGQSVDLLFFRNGHQVGSEKVDVHNGSGSQGTFKSHFLVRRDGRFAVQAVHEANASLAGASSVRKKFGVS